MFHITKPGTKLYWFYVHKYVAIMQLEPWKTQSNQGSLNKAWNGDPTNFDILTKESCRSEKFCALQLYKELKAILCLRKSEK